MSAERVDGYKDLTVTIPGAYRDSIAGHLAGADHTLDELDVVRYRLIADLIDKTMHDPTDEDRAEQGKFLERLRKDL